MYNKMLKVATVYCKYCVLISIISYNLGFREKRVWPLCIDSTSTVVPIYTYFLCTLNTNITQILFSYS